MTLDSARSLGPAGSRPPGEHVQHLGSKLEPRHSGLEHQTSCIPADWHLEASGSDHVGLTLDHGPALPAEAAHPSSLGLSRDGSIGGGGSGGEPAGAGVSAWQEAGPYLRLAAWVALLFVGYGFQRGLCAADLPYDCDSVDAAEVFTALTLTAFLGGALGWLAGVASPARFAWLAHWRRAYLWLLYAAVLPSYSAIASIPALRVSLATMDSWGPVPIILKVACVVVLVGAIGFHIWLALRTAGPGGAARAADADADGCCTPRASGAAVVPLAPDSPSGSSSTGSVDSGLSRATSASAALAASLKAFAAKCSLRPAKEAAGGALDGGAAAARRRRPKGARRRVLALYLLPRAAILLYFAVWFVVLPLTGSYSLHLHHYALGWAVASFASFNHPVSGIMLSAGTAMFVQGGSAYGFDPLFTPTDTNATGCLGVSSPSTGQMTCAFWSDKPFDIQFCTNGSWIPWFDCSVDWPWPATKVYPKTGFSGGGPAAPAANGLAALAAAMSKRSG